MECMSQEIDKQINNSAAASKNDNKKSNLGSAAPKDTLVAEVKYKSIVSTMKAIYRENGFFKGFFRGLTPRVLSNSPSCAISWGTYEIVKHFLSNKFKNNNKQK